MAAPVWLTHPASLGHDVPGHPERPERLAALLAALEERDWFGWQRVTAPAATRAQLERVHPAAHVDAIEALAAAGGGPIDADTAVVADSWPAALHAAGGAVALVDALLTGAAPSGFALHRPPGHHAEPDRAMGFCLLANVAVAAEHARTVHGVPRVLVVDFDVHHGNGTEACFAGRDDVLFASIHESPLYPGTGPASFVGVGAGEGHTVNLPVPAGSGDATFASLVEHVVAPLARRYRPGLVLVSAGFDAHALDPLAGCRVTEAGYVRMTRTLLDLGAELGAPVGFVLEGGYSVPALIGSVTAIAPVFTAAPGATAGLPVDPLAAAAVRRLQRWWPGLGAATA